MERLLIPIRFIDSTREKIYVSFNVARFSIFLRNNSSSPEYFENAEYSAGFLTDNLRYQKLKISRNDKHSRSVSFSKKYA